MALFVWFYMHSDGVNWIGLGSVGTELDEKSKPNITPHIGSILRVDITIE